MTARVMLVATTLVVGCDGSGDGEVALSPGCVDTGGVVAYTCLNESGEPQWAPGPIPTGIRTMCGVGVGVEFLCPAGAASRSECTRNGCATFVSLGDPMCAADGTLSCGDGAEPVCRELHDDDSAESCDRISDEAALASCAALDAEPFPLTEARAVRCIVSID